MSRFLSHSGFVLAGCGLSLTIISITLFVLDPNKNSGLFEPSKLVTAGSILTLVGIVFGLRARDFEEKR